MKSIISIQCGDIVYFNSSPLGAVIEPDDEYHIPIYGHSLLHCDPWVYVEDHLSYLPLTKEEPFNVIHRLTFFVWKNEQCPIGAFKVCINSNEAWCLFTKSGGNVVRVSVEKLTVGFQKRSRPSRMEVEEIFKDFDLIEIM